MIVFALMSLFAALLSMFLGNYVLYLNPKKQLNRLFYGLSICIFYWSFIEFGCRQAESYKAARIWLICISFWPFTMSFWLHFILIFTEKTRILAKRFLYTIIYLPAAVFSLAYLLMRPEVRGPIKVYWGWTFNLPREFSIYLFAHIWVFAIAIFTFVACVSYYIKVIDLQKKQQAIYVFTGITIAIVLGIITEIILPWMGIRVPELTTIGFFMANMFVGYAIWKYQLFILTPMTAADDIISTMPDALFLVDMENKILSVNTSALNVLGYQENEIRKQSINLVFKEIDTFIEKIKKRGAISDIETMMLTKDQRKVSVSLAASIVTGRSDVNFGIVFIARDITDRIQSIETLKESEDKFRGIAERSFDLIFMIDISGKVTYVSPSLEKLFLYHPEDVLGELSTKFVVPSDLQWMSRAYQEFNNGKDVGTIQMEVIKKDGSNATVEINVSRVFKGDKQVGTQGIIRDVSERIRSEAALKESEEKFKLIFENVNDAIVFIDPEGKIVEVNQKTEEIFGVNRSKSVGKNFVEFEDTFKIDEFQNVQGLFKGVVNGESGPTLQLNTINSQGSITIIEANARLIKKDHKLMGILAIVKDITKRKKLKRKQRN